MPVWWVIGGVGAVAATIAIMFVVMRKPADPGAPAKAPVPEVTAVAPPLPAAPPDAAVQVAAVTPDAAVAPQTVPTPPRTTPGGKEPTPKGKPPKVDDPPEAAAPDDDASVAETLKDAHAAYASGDFDLANRLANVAVNRGGARQRLQGAVLKGFVACEKKDLELVNAALNNLQGRAAMRKRVIARCAQRGVDVR